MSASKIKLGDTYKLEIYAWENDDQTIPRDLTGLKSATYVMCSSNNFDEVLTKLEWKTDPEVVIPDLTQGKIIVDIYTDHLNNCEGQLHQRLELVDESGRVTTVLDEFLNLDIPLYKR